MFSFPCIFRMCFLCIMVEFDTRSHYNCALWTTFLFFLCDANEIYWKDHYKFVHCQMPDGLSQYDILITCSIFLQDRIRMSLFQCWRLYFLLCESLLNQGYRKLLFIVCNLYDNLLRIFRGIIPSPKQDYPNPIHHSCLSLCLANMVILYWLCR